MVRWVQLLTKNSVDRTKLDNEISLISGNATGIWNFVFNDYLIWSDLNELCLGCQF